jgi:hypothetical protein
MSNEANKAEGQAPANQSGTAKPSTEEVRKAASGMTTEQMDELLSGSSNQSEATAREEAQPDDNDTAGKKPNEAESSGEPDGDNEQAEEPSPEKLGRFRHKARDYSEAELMSLGKSIHMREAAKKAFGLIEAVKPDETRDKKTAKPEIEVEAESHPALREIEKLSEDLEKALEAVDLREALKLNSKIDRLRDQVKADELRTQASVAESQKKAFRQKEYQFADEARKLLPQLGDKNSQLRKDFEAFVDLKLEDPDYKDVLNSPRWPVFMAREFAEAQGLSLRKEEQKKAQGIAAPRASAASVLTRGQQSSAQGVSPTREGLLTDMKKMSLAQLDSLM